MFCIHCGVKLPAHAKFCFQCGEKVEHTVISPQPGEQEAAMDTGEEKACEIIYVPLQEKIGLFPKEKGRYDAVLTETEGKKAIASSPVFDLGGLNIYGPAEKNPRHKAPFEQLVSELQQAGWVQQKKPGLFWYNITFTLQK